MAATVEQLFFELIRVSLGTQAFLSRTLTESEWKDLYAMARKHSVVGVCYVGVSRLASPGDYAGMGKDQYYDWTGRSVMIQQRNESVTQKCLALQEELLSAGIRNCVLKGQGIGSLYSSLQLFRQSGDIDLWCDADAGMVVAFAEGMGLKDSPGYLHVGTAYEGIPVELHYRPSYLRNLLHNARLQKFCLLHKDDWITRDGMTVPSLEFDAVYLLSHIFRHLFGLGIGMRQLMDYYFLLRALPDDFDKDSLKKELRSLGLYYFACAVMWVMKEVFRMDENYLLCAPDEKRGHLLLETVLQTGNFGQMDESQQSSRQSVLGSVKYKLRQWRQLVTLYPGETLSDPVWRLYKRFR